MSTSASGGASATPIDLTYQFAYRCAYQLMKAYWHVRKPTTHGTLVALWNDGQVLLVRNSYVKYYCAPGGYVRDGESGSQAAARELAEEVKVTVAPSELLPLHEETHEWEGKMDHVQIFSLELRTRPVIEIDNREVVDAAWFTRDEALKLDLFPPLRRALEKQHG